MDAFAKMDIFFFITALATVVLAVFMGVVLFYVVRAARDVSRITHVVRGESEKFAKGTRGARGKLGGAVEWLVALVQSFGRKGARSHKKDNNK
jgi:hypothetical protein